MKSSWLVLAIFFVATAATAQEDELARARFLDQQGVRAFADGRIHDAMTLFQESFRAGGPSNELWNVARCQLKLEDVEGARHTLESYLTQKDLSEDDRNEGRRLLDEIDHRPSTFVVASTPSGAVVTVDGRAVGMTPVVSTLPPGTHEVKVGRSEAGSSVRHVEARDGRPIVISVELAPILRGTPKSHASDDRHIRRLFAELGAFASYSYLGGGAVIEGTPSVELSGGYAPFVFHRVLFGFGLRLHVGRDEWSTNPVVSNAAIGCSPPNDYAAAELLAMPTVFGAVRATSRLTLGARAGIGAAIYISGTPIGGDLFGASCAFGGSLAPDGYAAIDVSIRMTDQLRLVFFPATLDVHPAYVNARNDATWDASGAWVRLGTGFALAVDL